MSVLISCPQCKARGIVPDEYEGTSVQCPECGREFVAKKYGGIADWKVGDALLDQYDVTGLLGVGGMGRVYKVHHRNWNMDLAVKRPRADFIERAGGTEDFEHEAETWVKLGLYPHIVSCYYVRRIEEIPCVFAEYVEGGSLHDWIRNGRLYEGGPDEALKRILDISIQFAWGLQYAHEQGLIHQDIKPANVMMTSDGIAKVTDFGLSSAKGMHRGAQLESGESIFVTTGGYTPAYASPEQLNGQKLTRRTDVWSFGLSILEMFTGEVTWRVGVAAPMALEAYLKHGPGQVQQSDKTKGLLAGLLRRKQRHPTDKYQDMPRMPQALCELLQNCFKTDPHDRPVGMKSIEKLLQEIYCQEVKEDFYRPRPSQVREIADSLNNWAVSLLDLGQQEKALNLWDKALQIQPHHPEATYNRGLILWRKAEIDDQMFVKQIQEMANSHEDSWLAEYLLGLAHLERGDCENALLLFNGIYNQCSEQKTVRSAITDAKKYLRRSRKLLRTFEGHESQIISVSISNDGQFAVSGSYDEPLNLRMWDLSTGSCLHALQAHDESIEAVFLGPDGHYALTGSRDTMIKLWDMESGDCLCTYKGHTNWVKSVFLGFDGVHMLSGSSDGTLKLWEVNTGICIRTFDGHKGEIASVYLSHDSRLALSGSSDNTLNLWEVNTGRCLHTFEGHTEGVSCISVTHDERYLVSASWDNTLRIWNLETGQCVQIIRTQLDGITSLSTSSDGRYAVTGSSREEAVQLWDLHTGRCLCTYAGHKNWVSSVSISTDERYVLSGSWDRTLKLWATSVEYYYAAPLALIKAKKSEAILSDQLFFEQQLSAAKDAFSRNESIFALKHLKLARSLPGYNRDIDAMTVWAHLYLHFPHGNLTGGWEIASFTAYKDYVLFASFSSDGRYFLYGGRDNIFICEAESGLCIRTLKGHSQSVFSATISRDGGIVLSGGEDKLLKLWDVKTSCCIRVFEGHRGNVYSVDLSYDGLLALSGSEDKSLKLWDTKTGYCIQTFLGHQGWVFSVCFSHDGRFALSGSHDGTLKLWEIISGHCLQTFKGHTGYVRSVCMNVDGSYAISGSWDGTIKIWDVKDGCCMRTLHGHVDGINSVCLSVDGRILLSGSKDKTIKIWDLLAGECVRTFEGHKDNVVSVSLSRDNRFVLSRSHDGSFKLWVLDWELPLKKQADWDDGAYPYLEAFLANHLPPISSLTNEWQNNKNSVSLVLTRRGKPAWTEDNFKELLYTLGCAGYGWLKPEGVRCQLDTMASNW